MVFLGGGVFLAGGPKFTRDCHAFFYASCVHKFFVRAQHEQTHTLTRARTHAHTPVSHMKTGVACIPSRAGALDI